MSLVDSAILTERSRAAENEPPNACAEVWEWGGLEPVLSRGFHIARERGRGLK
jgi:hypothetical protein